MKQASQKEKYTYYCPHCDQVLAIGTILSCDIMCPSCTKQIGCSQHSRTAVSVIVKKPLGTELYKKSYGKDRLTIEEMKTNQKDCIKAGHTHYFSGKPCKYGHIAPRTKRGDCNQCNRIYAKKHKGAVVSQ